MSQKTPLALPPSRVDQPSALARGTVTAALSSPLLTTEQREAVHAAARNAFAGNTLKNYGGDWRTFQTWCTKHGHQPVPVSAEALAAYLAELRTQGRKAATISHHLAAIKWAHIQAGALSHKRGEWAGSSTVVQTVLRGVSRRAGAQRQMEPVLAAELMAMLAKTPRNISGARDRALLVLGWSGAFRVSELVALDVADLTFDFTDNTGQRGLYVLVRSSKTDQRGEGKEKGIPEHEVAALDAGKVVRAWLDIAGIKEGAVFRSFNKAGQVRDHRLSTRAVIDLVKRYALAIGLDPKRFASHSLRAGHVTTRLDAGETAASIRLMTGHSSTQMVERYDRRKKRNVFAGTSANPLRPKESK